MDSRTALAPNTELIFDGSTRYRIRREVGRGGSCIVYDALYRTNAGDQKTVRIKECYPFDLRLERNPDDSLSSLPEESARFAEAQEQMYADFRLCNELFYAEPASDAIINHLNIHRANNTVYIISAWSGENALPNIVSNSIRDCLSIVCQTAYAVQCIHQAGYLYLDIKPDNISVVNSVSKRVQLFDFDSLIPLSALKDASEYNRRRLSYTKGFAALELRQGLISKLGPHTDIYGIGALLFFLLFGRIPEAPDCSNGAVYDFSSIRFSGQYPDRFFILLEKFFHRTLAGFPMDRYPGMDVVVRELENLERYTDPAYPYLIQFPRSAPAFFIGRETELASLESWAADHTRKVLFISGMGGIGKSALIRQFLAHHSQEWDSVVILSCSHSLRQSFCDDRMLRINGTERFPEEKESDYFSRKLRKFSEISRRDRVLLVIENFGNEYDPDLGQILSLGCKTVFLTRRTLGSLNYPILKLEAIPEPNVLRDLFLHYLERQNSPEDAEIIQRIIEDLGGHTLALELFARQIANSFLSLPEALSLLETRGLLHISSDRVDYQRDDRIRYERLERIISRLFETDHLSEDQTSLLKAAALFPAPGISGRELIRLAGIDGAEPVSRLVSYGWITREDTRVFLHPLIRDVIRNIPNTEKNLTGVMQVLQNLQTDISEESHKEELRPGNIPAQLANMPPEEIVTDHVKLLDAVTTACGVIDVLRTDAELSVIPTYRKLMQAAVINLPEYADTAIMRYGTELLAHPEALSPLDLMETAEAVEKVLLADKEFDAAVRLTETMKNYAVDERTTAEYYGLLSNICDSRDAPGDREKLLDLLECGIRHARLAPRPERKHLLAEFLIGEMNLYARYGLGSEEKFDALFREVQQIAETECLPYSEIRHGLALAMGFYWVYVGEDPEEAEKWIQEARSVAVKLYPIALDYIDRMLIPSAFLQLDLGNITASEAILMEGVRICEERSDMIAYIRKRHELHRCLLDVWLTSDDYAKAGQMVLLLDEGCTVHGFPDPVDPAARAFLQSRGFIR